MPLYVGPASSNSAYTKKVTQNNNIQKPQPKKEEPKPGAARRAWNWLGYQAKYTAAFWAKVASGSSTQMSTEDVTAGEAASTFILAGLALNPIAWLFTATGCAGPSASPSGGDPVQDEVLDPRGNVVQDLASNATTGDQTVETEAGEELQWSATLKYVATGGINKFLEFILFTANRNVAGKDYDFTNPAGDPVTISIPDACADYYAGKEGFQFIADPSYCESTLDGDTTNDLESESVPIIVDGWSGWCDTGYESVTFTHLSHPPEYSLPRVVADVSDGTVSNVGFGIPGEEGYIPSGKIRIPVPAACTRNDGAVPYIEVNIFGRTNALNISWPIKLPWATFIKAQALVEPKD